MKQSFSLAEVAAAYLPDEWSDSVRWLSRRLNRGEISGYRVGRVWRMRQSDIDAMLTKFSNATTTSPEPVHVVDESIPPLTGISERSRRRLRAS